GRDAFGDLPEVEETGTTFAENARLKARAMAEATGLWCLADDSGLAVDALNGAPGVHSARYVEGSDRDRYEALLQALKDVSDGARQARFHCALCLARSEEHTSELQSRENLVCRLLLEKKNSTSVPSTRARLPRSLTS